jgi:rhodanese-related sulfurtransferase
MSYNPVRRSTQSKGNPMKNKFKTPDPKKARRYFSRKLAFTTGPVELGHLLKERKDIRVLDVRDAKSFAKGHLPGAVNLPEERWQKTTTLDKKKTYIVYCDAPTCHLAARAAFELSSQGFPVMELEGGIEAWKQTGHPIERSSAARRPPPRKPVAQPEEEAEQPETESARAIAAAEA